MAFFPSAIVLALITMVSGWVTWTIVGLRLTAYCLRVGRGSGLKRICNETKALESYRDDRRPVFKSSPSQFMTTIYSMEYSQADDDAGNGELNNATEISDKTGVPFSTIDKHIRVLLKNGKIERRGSKKTGGYYVK